MEWLSAPDYETARVVLQRGVALVYLIAFVNVRNQFRPLLGAHGLLPVPGYIARTTFRSSPSLFHWGYSDGLLAGVAWVGTSMAAASVLGIPDLMPAWATIPWWLAIWGLYLSVVNVGQIFYGFGWESLLLEAGFYTAFLGNVETAPPIVTLLAFRWLLFRVEFGAGMIKMRGDRCWRDLTCLDYHHETQPMPGPASRWFHLLPGTAHRVEVASNHLAQLVAPFLLFLPQPLAGVGAMAMILTQGYLVVSGNYAWLNVVTLVLGFVAVPDAWYGAVGVSPPDAAAVSPSWFGIVTLAVGAGVVALSYRPVRNLLAGRQLMNFSFNRYHLVNTYGAFGTVTRRRREVVIEGNAAVDPDDGEWRTYRFKGKPTDPNRRPGQFAPYHLRLDWMMWFVALSPSYGRGWLDTFVERLLQSDEKTLRLLAHDPFSGTAPRWVRGRLVDYRFSTRSERRETGAIWITGNSRVLFEPVSLEE